MSRRLETALDFVTFKLNFMDFFTLCHMVFLNI